MSDASGIRGRRPLAALSFVLAATIAFVVFRVLPVRVLPVDAVAAALIVARLAAGFGLLRGGEGWRRFAFGIALTTLVVGLVVVALLGVSISVVSGLYDAVGAGAAMAYALLLLLLVPYLIVFPALELRALAARTS